MVIVLFGPTGAGNSTVGNALAARLGWRFVDADDYHSMKKPREDASEPAADRRRSNAVARSAPGRHRRRRRTDEPTVVACSALKRDYRRVLAQDSEALALVYLRATPQVLE